MHNGFREAIEVRPRPGCALWLTGALTCSAGACVVLADIAPAWRALALATIGVMALAVICQRMSIRGRRYVERAVLLPDGRWTLLCGDTELVNARLCGVWGAQSGPLLALEWRCDDGRRWQAWLLERDLTATTWRRLRVRLSLS